MAMKKSAPNKRAAKKRAAPKPSAGKRTGAKKRGASKMSASKKGASPSGAAASKLIDAAIAALTDWRGPLLKKLRALVKQADPAVVEEWKWGIPVWSHAGLLCTGETYKSAVKMTFARGAALPDPAKLFTSSLGGNTRRAVDFHEGDKLNEKALKTLVRAAVTLNMSKA